MRSLLRVLMVLTAVSVCSLHAATDWPPRTDTSVAVAVAPGNQWNVRLAPDGASGAFMAWQDRRSGIADKIFLQHTSATGNPFWTDGGIPLASTPGFQYYPQIISDGSGGMYVVWQDNRNGLDYDIFAQHISPEGFSIWAGNGVPVCTAPGHQYNPQFVRDGLGGLIIVWQDRRAGQFDIYAQRLDQNGNAIWATDGVPVCSAPYDQIEPRIGYFGLGGAIVSWLDYRGGNGFTDVYAQRIIATGSGMWTANGVAVCTAPNIQWNHQLVTDPGKSAIIVWQDRRSSNYDNVYAQKLDGTGAALWAADGVALAQVSGAQYYPQIVVDNAGGAVAVWQDNRAGGDYNIVAQHVSSNGTLLWPAQGYFVCDAPGHQYNPQIALQDGDVVIAWQDKRSGDFDIYAQRVRLDGVQFWQDNGNPVSKEPTDQFMPQIVSDGHHGAIIAWPDYHLGGSTTDLFSQRVAANGLPGGGAFRTFAQEQFGLKAVRYRNRYYPFNSIGMPNEGNVRDSLFARGAFSRGLVVGVERPDSIRFYGWQYFTRSIYVRRAFPQNGAAAPFDRVFEHKFVGRMKNPPTIRYNNRLSGELLALRLNIAASDVGMTPPGLGELVFQDTSSKSNPLNGLSLRAMGSRVDTFLTLYKKYPADYNQLYAALKKVNDAFLIPFDTASSSPLIITASRAMFSVPFLLPSIDLPPPPPSFQPTPEDVDEPTTFSLLQNYPNPFNPLTTIEFTILEPSTVSLSVYNVLGQEVAKLMDQVVLDEGRQIVDFDATNLSTGVYFYRLVAVPTVGEGKMVSQVRKMMLLK